MFQCFQTNYKYLTLEKNVWVDSFRVIYRSLSNDRDSNRIPYPTFSKGGELLQESYISNKRVGLAIFVIFLALFPSIHISFNTFIALVGKRERMQESVCQKVQYWSLHENWKIVKIGSTISFFFVSSFLLLGFQFSRFLNTF